MTKQLETVFYSNNLEIGKERYQWQQRTSHGKQASLLTEERHLPAHLRPVALVRRDEAEAIISELKSVITDLRLQLETQPSPDVEQEEIN